MRPFLPRRCSGASSAFAANAGGDRTAVDALVKKIDLEMPNENASLIPCRYSDEPFNTNEVIAPHWTDIPLHPPSLMTFAALALLAGVAVLPMRRPWS
jgi:hypothetical protein